MKQKIFACEDTERRESDLMTEFIHVHTTTDSRNEAQKIAETVVARRLAAEEPAIVATPFVAGSQSYFDWIVSETTRK